MAATIDVAGRSPGSLRYLVIFDAETQVVRTGTQMAADHSFQATPLAGILGRSYSSDGAAQRALFGGQFTRPISEVVDTEVHAVVTCVQVGGTGAESLSFDVSRDEDDNTIRFEVNGPANTSWLIDIRLDHTYVQ